FEEKGIRSVLLGYPYGQKGYKLFDLQKRKMYMCRDVVFKEDIFPFLNPKQPVLQTSQQHGIFPLLVSDEIEENDFFDDGSNGESIGNFDSLNLNGTGQTPIESSPQVSETGENSPTLEVSSEENTQVIIPTEQPLETRRSERPRTVPNKYKDFVYKIPGVETQSDQSTSFTVQTMKEMKNHSADFMACIG
ncbi:hypothetical protein SOVF_213850, partial [Spinacia oleracea]